jgi:hypothetical protein
MSVPIPLTLEQIDDILLAVPDVPGVGKFAKDIAKRHLQDRIRAILEEIKLVPIQEAFNEFKQEIIRSIYESFIEQYKPVGVAAGVALGGPVTQLSLNSFHMAGAQSGVALAFQKIRDFLTGSKMNRNPQTKIFFKQVTHDYPASDLHDTLHRGTFDSIAAIKPSFEQIMVQDLILKDGVHILSKEEAISSGVDKMVDLHASVRPHRFTDWKNRFPLTYVVEIKLNTYRMYTHSITMGMVALAIEGPEPTDTLTVVWRSQIDGRVYIIVDETRNYGLESMTQQSSILMYLHRDVIKRFGQWKVSGITDILSIEPQEVDVTRGIYQIKTSKENPLHHHVYTTNYRTRWEGISLADIHHLFTTAGFQVIDLNKDDLYITVQYDSNNPKLQKAIQQAQNTPANKQSNLQKSALKKNLSLIDAIKLIIETSKSNGDTDVIEASTFWYALANGTNMDELSWRQDLDLYRLTSSHPHEVLEILGIDAAMVFLTLRFRQTLSDFGAYINPRHISLTFALLCNLGIINSLSFAGINRRRIGPLAMASYERSMNVFMNSATFGDKEAIVGVSPSIYVGQKSKKVGTGAVQIEQDLTVVTRDAPILPSLDEESVLDGLSLPTMSGGFTQLKMTAPPLQSISLPTPVDKSAITKTTIISSIPRKVEENFLPTTTQITAPSPVLQSALNKISPGTGLEFIPDTDLPEDITSVEDITGLSLIPPQRLKPEPIQMQEKGSVSRISPTAFLKMIPKR